MAKSVIRKHVNGQSSDDLWSHGSHWSALVVDNVDMILQEIVNQNNINQPEQGESRD